MTMSLMSKMYKMYIEENSKSLRRAVYNIHGQVYQGSIPIALRHKSSPRSETYLSPSAIDPYALPLPTPTATHR